MEVTQPRGSTAKTKATKSSNEKSLKVVESSRKKLAALVAQGIARVLDECIQKVDVVSKLPGLLDNIEAVSIGLGEALGEVLREHCSLADVLDAQQLKYLGEERHAELNRLEHGVRSSLKNVLRLLFTDPAATQMLQSLTGSTAFHQLIEGLKKLQHLILEEVLLSPEEERERNGNLKKVEQQHKTSMELRSKLEAEVAAALQFQDAEISKKNEIIYNLKSSLYQINNTSLDFVTHAQMGAEKQSQSDRKMSESRRMQMQQEVDQLQMQLNNLIAENRERETALRKRSFKVETEIENWIQKYDKDMGEKQAELEELSSLCAKEKEELQDLEEHFALLEVEFLQIMEEKRLARQREEEEQRELTVKSCAALIIQAYWRGYKVRKMIKAKKKGKKGKKAK